MRPSFSVAAAALTSASLAGFTGGAGSAQAQTPAPRPVEALPDVARLTPAEVAFVHPLSRALAGNSRRSQALTLSQLC